MYPPYLRRLNQCDLYSRIEVDQHVSIIIIYRNATASKPIGMSKFSSNRKLQTK